MIKSDSIERVRLAADIVDVVGRDVKLKRSGATLSGCCCFHDEKTPSLRVFPNTQTYKCFGCGEGGDAIKFVMKTRRLNYPEAVEALAQDYNISLEYHEHVDKEAQKQVKEKKERVRDLLQFAQTKYEQLLWSLPEEAEVVQYLNSRGYTDERIKKWGLGFAPADWKFLTSPLIERGKFSDAVEANLTKTKSGTNYDALHNRIIFPLYDHMGMLTGLSGRVYTAEDSEKHKNNKYLNPPNGITYNKSQYWYGLWQAIPSIKKEEYAIIVEGYTDVHAMHDIAEMTNTIAACGTAITDDQVKLLKRYTNHVVLCYDGDDAGVEAAMKNIDIFLKWNFKVQVCELPGKMDPDEFIREFSADELASLNVSQ